MRETWLNENQRLVSQDNFGNDIAAVEAATKKHEAIETDIMVWLLTLLLLTQWACIQRRKEGYQKAMNYWEGVVILTTK